MEDADAIKIGDDTLRLLYKNNCIRDYLYNSKNLGLSGTKGQGKTFLIKSKRLLLQNGLVDKDTPIVCFPKDALMVDTLDNALTPNKSLIKYVSSYDIWVRIWKFSIALTVISSDECEKFFSVKDFEKLSKVTKSLMQINNGNRKPSIIIHALLSRPIKDFITALNDTNALLVLLNNIHHGVYIFIDKVEQGFSDELQKASRNKRERSESIRNWYYSQYALAQAAYDIFSNANAHIKVYYTIRQEALLEAENMAPNLARNIGSFIVELSYSKNDIREMFALYVENEADANLNSPKYKSHNPEFAFVGFNSIEHHYVMNGTQPHTETVFEYIYRHSLRRPCDLMSLCRQVYVNDPLNMDKDLFRKVINNISGRVLKRYLAEVEPFTVLSYKNIEDLLKCINTNIFNLEYMEHVCERFNNEYGSSVTCKKDCINCKQKHPFSTLYNIGLLGYLHSRLVVPKYEQRFLPVGYSQPIGNKHAIKESDFYLLHPCLWDIARDLRQATNRDFSSANETVVGEGITIDEEKVLVIRNRVPSLICKLRDDKVFVSSTINDLGKERRAIKASLIKKGFYPIMSESDNFTGGSNHVDSHDHCIDELLKCSKMIFIIGAKIGGAYSGNRFVQYRDDIYEHSLRKIASPSISLMEFYVAKRHNLSYNVFIAQAILDALNNTDDDTEQAEMLESLGIDYDVRTLVNFVNHLKTNGKREGNWMHVYRDIPDLKRRINNIGFS